MGQNFDKGAIRSAETTFSGMGMTSDKTQISAGEGRPELTVIVAVDGIQGLAETLAGYREGIEALGKSHEVICITDGRDDELVAGLYELAAEWPALTVLGQRPWGGDDAALASAVRRARGDLVLTLPGWPEVDPDSLAALFDGIGNADMVSADRGTPNSSGWQGFRRGAFDRVLRGLFGTAPSDPFCRVRLVRRTVLEDVCGFGVRQHFIPVIAAQRGYKLVEAPVSAAPASGDRSKYVFKPLGHFRAFFDALALYVVLKFLRRPLRFFGAIGLPIFVLGTLATLALLVQKYAGGVSLADRPALIFAVLMVVLGIQVIALGLVGEIIIFANSRRMKQYAVESVIRGGDVEPEGDTTQRLVMRGE